MEGLIVFLLVTVALAIGLKYMKRDKVAPSAHENEEENEWEKELRKSQEHLAAALKACQDNHPQATDALSWLAAADGSVSKQELRTIFRFCADQGTVIDKAAFKAIDDLNAGMTMRVRTTESDAHQAVAALSDKPAAYRLAFYGTANKLCGSQKHINEAKQRFLKAAEGLATMS